MSEVPLNAPITPTGNITVGTVLLVPDPNEFLPELALEGAKEIYGSISTRKDDLIDAKINQFIHVYTIALSTENDQLKNTMINKLKKFSGAQRDHMWFLAKKHLSGLMKKDTNFSYYDYFSQDVGEKSDEREVQFLTDCMNNIQELKKELADTQNRLIKASGAVISATSPAYETEYIEVQEVNKQLREKIKQLQNEIQLLESVKGGQKGTGVSVSESEEIKALRKDLVTANANMERYRILLSRFQHIANFFDAIQSKLGDEINVDMIYSNNSGERQRITEYFKSHLKSG
jgi:uncharacterized protein (DUF342 family)